MSLYSHVASKDALLDGIVEAMTREAQLPPVGETDWRDALRHLASEIRGITLRHLAAAPLLASRRVRSARGSPARSWPGCSAPGTRAPMTQHCW